VGLLSKIPFAKIKDAVAKNPEKVEDAIDKVAGLADSRTGKKHTSKIDSAAGKAKDLVGKLEDDQSKAARRNTPKP
jgi:uncharacterized protein YjbJ (UPF0337 family)